MDLSGDVAKILTRTDAKNLVNTARTIHLLEEKEAIHMLSILRKEACSGTIHDLAHIPTQICLAACLTKSSAKADNLITAGSVVDYESQKIKRTVLSTTVAGFLFVHEMFRFMPVSSWIVDGLIRWNCRYSLDDLCEYPGDDSKNDSFAWTTGYNPHDVYVAKGSLLRKYSWSCLHSNSELFGRLFDEGIGEGRELDHSSENREIIRC